MRLIYVVPRITSEALGPAYSVMALCDALRHQGARTRLDVLEPATDNPLPDWVHVFPDSGGPFQLGRSNTLHGWLRSTVGHRAVDIIHSHSLWMIPNVYRSWITKGHNTRSIDLSDRWDSSRSGMDYSLTGAV